MTDPVVGASLSGGWALLEAYRVQARVAVQREMQYRLGNFLNLMGFLIEPTILLTVWTAVATARGGHVHGYDAGSIAAYYIVWTLVRAFNLVLGGPSFEWRIARGEMSALMLRPMHPIHFDIAWFSGWKVVVTLFWLPIAAVLVLTFHPTLNPSWLQVVVFFFALWGAFLIRALVQWALGLICFWTTRAGSVFSLYLLIELLLSGRLVPLSFLPHWANTLNAFLPVQWMFYFPIEALTGHESNVSLVLGLGAQAVWVALMAGVVAMVWKRAVRRHAAVGN